LWIRYCDDNGGDRAGPPHRPCFLSAKVLYYLLRGHTGGSTKQRDWTGEYRDDIGILHLNYLFSGSSMVSLESKGIFTGKISDTSLSLGFTQ
jgi:hypothetical protein